MKKILLGISVFAMTLASAQYYPDTYPNNGWGNGGQNNGYYYGDDEDEFYFPDDYYYQYPSDYYTDNYYQSYYNDYRRSIYDINWNRFFRMYRLSPWQVQQIIMLNEMYPSFSAWNNYYRYNPDRWYYDRFYALERILGPRIFVIFQNNFYGGYSPVVYYQNYRRQHYAANVYIIPRYRNINVNRYRVDRVQYHQNNPRPNFGFTDNGRTRSGNNSGFRNDSNSNQNGGFRNDTNSNNGFRNDTNSNQNGGFRNNTNSDREGGFRNNQGTAPRVNTEHRSGGFRSEQNSGGFRNDSAPRENSIRNSMPERKIENNSGSETRSPGFRTPNNSGGGSGLRLTSH
ncbi:hypothetical protein MTP09_11990 [Chryseobacterium suipulveris]|uniref:Uncharacterized protein n=1 Tax=Chryseobacterium suipulveris TaxID=2929800 RepID=A0ABY4BN37_9FLAO|nr:hypothetical protein [Chryseobacterium suipulveris]UOE40613.1 hypothetical protein MTP09_11990 [Chryseobacterium suipulveris]